MPDTENALELVEKIKKAAEIGLLANVPVMLRAESVLRLVTQHNNAVIHLVKIMDVALANLEYAPSSDKVEGQMDAIFAARDFLLESGLVTEDMLR